MIAHQVEKSRIGIFGFDIINLFTNDEIFCSGFTPDPFQIEAIANFIERLNLATYSDQPICIYLSYKSGLFWVELKIHCFDEPLFANGQEVQFHDALRNVEKKILKQIPKLDISAMESHELNKTYN